MTVKCFAFAEDGCQTKNNNDVDKRKLERKGVISGDIGVAWDFLHRAGARTKTAQTGNLRFAVDIFQPRCVYQNGIFYIEAS